MRENYQDVVLAAYQKKRDSGELSLIMPRTTTVKLRRYCLKIYKSRYDPKDADILSTFFNVDKVEANFHQIIDGFDPDEFRPLLNHLKEKTSKTDDKNSELLAWLIDFKPRPSTLYYKSLETNKLVIETDDYIDTGNDEEIIADPEEKIEEIETVDKETVHEGVQDDLPQGRTLDDDNSGDTGNIGQKLKEESTPVKDSDNDLKPPKKIPIVIITCGVAIIIFISACLTQFWKDKSKRLFNVNPLISINTCMYWTGDHYEQIKCDQKGIAVLKIPFNKYVFENFEKITLPDTLTSNSLGKVWYSKQNNKVDFYTDSAAHPTDDNRRLLPLTQYMLNKNVSYKRYVLNIIYWSIGITFFIVLFGGGAIYLGIVIRKWKQNKAAK